MNLRRLTAAAFATLAVFVCLAWFAVPASAQTPVSRVDFTVSGLDYDVIYLADFLDVGSGKLKEFVPAFSAEMRPLPAGASSSVRLSLKTYMILKDDPTMYTLTDGLSNAFTFGPASRSIYSKDLIRGGSSDIKMTPQGGTLWNESNAGKKKLEEHLKRFPSAPVGTYRFVIEIISATTGLSLGRTQYDLVVRNASADEVVVTLIDPQPGEVLRSTSPQFAWRADRESELYVYERLPLARSLQDAVAGIPHAVVNVGTTQTIAYPSTARKLEYGKTYVWFVRTKVTTNRGDEYRDSEVRAFHVMQAGQDVSSLRDDLTLDDEALKGTLTTLESMGWIPSGDITLDGKPISREEAKAVLQKLGRNRTPIKVHVE